MSDNDFLVTGNLRFGGPIRQRLLMDGQPARPSDAHAPYLKVAHKLLESVLQQMDGGIKLAQNQRRLALPDGAVITASSRFGQHEISIDLPTSQRTTSSDSETTTEPEPEEEHEPYLWVGARVAWDRYPEQNNTYHNALMIAVYEPSVSGEPQGVVSNYPLYEYGGPGWPGYAEINPRPPQSLPRWWGETFADDNSYVNNWGEQSPPLVQTTQRGLYMTALTMPHEVMEGAIYQGPNGVPVNHGDYYYSFYYGSEVMYDPREKPEDAPARPWGALSDYTDADWFHKGTPLWDAVAVLDPKPWIGGEGDLRKNKLNIAKMFARHGISPTALAGKYVIKIGFWGPCDYGLPVDIEVRVGKNPTLTKRFTCTVTNGAGLYQRTSQPLGEHIPDIDCPHATGNNPHYNWWQGGVTVDVKGNGIRQHDDYLPDWGFEPASYPGTNSCGSTMPDYIIFCTEPFAAVAYWQGLGTHLERAAMVYALMANAYQGSIGSGHYDPSLVSFPTPSELDTLTYTDLGIDQRIYDAARRDVTGFYLYRYHAMETLGSEPYFEALPYPNTGISIAFFESWVPPYEAAAQATGQYANFLVTMLSGPSYSANIDASSAGGCPG